MNKNAERGVATRERVLAHATRLFASRGYDGTSIGAVLRESNLSKGSLYHHFEGKEALFRAVFEEMQEQVGKEIQRAAERESTPVAALRAGCLAWIRLADDPAVRQVMLLDAPSVLGWHRWRTLDDDYTLGSVKAALARASRAGRLEPRQVTMFAHIIVAAVNEVALVIARAHNKDAAIADGETAIAEVLRRLLGD
ncbi:TetR/AcrR family transcriptional regulator [Pseudonocardia acaciae]|uniref:TetR/AcrR family transcriptional regulator n=1 Tax=Pseudonocardia acaciae TaxID=551276 RepID=UPI00048B5082|nr:TetR/AcrR family transcriptional regulator [Pseudonocardia acaciae]